MAIEEITGVAALDEVILAEERGVVIDFWGTWCQPCRILRPHLEQLAETHASDWRFVAVHAEENVDLVEKFDVQSTPTLIYLRSGDEIHRSVGAITPTGVAADLIAVTG